MVAAPEDYAWSSYRSNALAEENPIITPHADYLALGRSETARRAAYQDLFATVLDRQLVTQMRQCLKTGTPLENKRFCEQIEHTLGRKGLSPINATPENLEESYRRFVGLMDKR